MHHADTAKIASTSSLWHWTPARNADVQAIRGHRNYWMTFEMGRQWVYNRVWGIASRNGNNSKQHYCWSLNPTVSFRWCNKHTLWRRLANKGFLMLKNVWATSFYINTSWNFWLAWCRAIAALIGDVFLAKEAIGTWSTVVPVVSFGNANALPRFYSWCVIMLLRSLK